MKIRLFAVVMILCFFIPELNAQENQDNVQITRKYNLTKSYIFKKESLLVGEFELYFSYFVGNLESDIKIIGAGDQHYSKQNFADFDELYINKGLNDNISVGDKFQILGKGKVVKHPFSKKTLGNVFVKKGICTVTCVYDTKAIIKIDRVGNPVYIGDLIIPYKKQTEIFEQRPEYRRCKLPESKIQGDVVYMGEYLEVNRDLGGRDQMIAVDLGQEFLKKGDYLLFYYKLKNDFPAVITGLGIVVSSHNKCSMVKILDASRDIFIGENITVNTKVVPLTVERTKKEAAVKITPVKNEEAPVVTEKLAEEGVYEKELYYDINSIKPKSGLGEAIEEIKNSLVDKQEYVVIVRGYTCTIGREEYNLQLSQKRVEFIKKELMEKLGIEESYIETYFYGEKDCKFDNSNELERQKNRRILIEVRAK